MYFIVERCEVLAASDYGLWRRAVLVEVYRRFESSAAYIVYPLKRLYTYTITRHISDDIISNVKAGLLKICSFMFVCLICN